MAEWPIQEKMTDDVIGNREAKRDRRRIVLHKSPSNARKDEAATHWMSLKHFDYCGMDEICIASEQRQRSGVLASIIPEPPSSLFLGSIQLADL